ncbi:MAG TPA: TonB-dependent receptor [Sphingobium sp.]|uniref:TonB-dependent receptor n=1 Tax=Sphingobium sp. TaxID=1912891 RepID=UPI002ED12440
MATRMISLIALAIASVSPSQLLAQDLPAADASDGRPGDIVVNAQRRADTALKEQSAALNIVNIQSAETIAKYPDVNAAEALSRVAGVALSIDTSEGRFVNIRGLDGNLNGATFGGVVLLNTQPGGTYFNAAGRAVEFDTVPIGAIDRIVVIKTGLPDHDAEGIGGSIELTPRTAIGMQKPFAEVTLGGGIETFKGTGLYRDEVVLGAPFGGKNANGDAPFSVVVSQFLYNDRRTFDDIEAAYKDNQPATPDKAFDALELRKYGYNRKRFGYSGEFDFTPNAEQRLYVRGSLAGYNEHVSRNRLTINGLGDSVLADPANPNGLIATGASTEKTLRDEEETHRNLVIQVGGDHHFGLLHVDWFAAYSRATYHKLYDYNSTFSGPSNLTIAYDNSSDPNYPQFGVTSGASITDPANYSLSSIGNQSEYSQDREWSYALNVGMPIGLTADDELKIGGKLRYRHKSSLPYGGSYTSATAPLLSQFASGGAVTNFYRAGYNIGPVIDGDGVRQLFDASGTPLTLNTGSFFDDNEDVSAAYAQYKASFGSLGVLAGLRFEHTSTIYGGIGDAIVGGTIVNGPLSTNRSYDNWFPTLQLRYQAMPSLVLRATYSTGLARPGFYQTIQATSIDPATNTVSTGNPGLKPTYSHNFDIGAEYRLPGDGLISIGAFDKELKNYVVTRTVRGSFPGLTGIVTIDTFENVSGSHVRGLEGAFVDKFTGLPGMLGGLGVDANVTYVDSAVALRDGESVALPGTFKWSWNAAVFYERGPVKMRLSPQYESSVLFGVGSTRATDIFQDHRFTLDLNGSYDLCRNVQLYFNAKNLTNAPLRFYEGTPNRPIQREFYDVTLEGGIKLHL